MIKKGLVLEPKSQPVFLSVCLSILVCLSVSVGLSVCVSLSVFVSVTLTNENHEFLFNSCLFLRVKTSGDLRKYATGLIERAG